jgi:hypothetical protein
MAPRGSEPAEGYGDSQAVVWRAGSRKVLATRGHLIAGGLNRFGTVAGWDPSKGPVVWRHGAVQLLPAPAWPLTIRVEIGGVNDADQVGGTLLSYTEIRPVLWTCR